VLSAWLAATLLAGAALGAEPDLDCSDPPKSRAWLDRLRLAEIEGAEDIHRAAMWEAFGTCPAGDSGTACRGEIRKRFEAEWETQKQAIEDKYRQALSDLEERCRAQLAGREPPVAGPWEG
jgi:hypothetical protein